VDRYSFLVRPLHSLLHAGLSRRTGTCSAAELREQHPPATLHVTFARNHARDIDEDAIASGATTV
jgi:hypothetical protein